MAQFIAVAISVFVALSASAAMLFNASHQVQIYMPPPPPADGNPAGVSGGGPVGTGPIAIPTPPSSTGH